MIVPFNDQPLIFLELTGAFCFHRHQRGLTREGDQRASLLQSPFLPENRV